MLREIAEFSDITKISKYLSKYRGKLFWEIEHTGIIYVRHKLSLSFRSVKVCLNTALSDYEKIIQDFLHGRNFGKTSANI